MSQHGKCCKILLTFFWNCSAKVPKELTFFFLTRKKLMRLLIYKSYLYIQLFFTSAGKSLQITKQSLFWVIGTVNQKNNRQMIKLGECSCNTHKHWGNIPWELPVDSRVSYDSISVCVCHADTCCGSLSQRKSILFCCLPAGFLMLGIFTSCQDVADASA